MNRRTLLSGSAAFAALASIKARAGNPPPLPQSQIKLGHRYTHKMFNSVYGTAGGTGQTWSAVVRLAAAPYAMRVIFFNASTTTAYPISGAAFAFTSTPGTNAATSTLPANASGTTDSTLEQQLTFSGGGSLTATPHTFSVTPGTMLTGSVPACSNANVPTLYASDWLTGLTPLARIDGGTGYLGIVRCYSTANVQLQTPITGPLASSLSYPDALYWGAGNLTTTPWATCPSSYGATAFYAVQYLSNQQGITLMGVGDSIMMSLQSSASGSGFGALAANAVSRMFPQIAVEYFNEGYPGRISDNYIGCGLQDLAAFAPQMSLVQMWSENNQDATNTLASAYHCYDQGLELADAVHAAGGWPILIGPAPVGVAEGSPGDGYRTTIRNLLRSGSAAGYYDYVDLDTLVGSGASPSAYASGFNNGDGKHPNDAACAVIAAPIANLVAQRMGL